MDDELQREGELDHVADAHEQLEQGAERDLLDEPVMPLLGLSTATILAVFIGGALGSVARYELAAHHPAGSATFPWVTLLVNLTGSFAIGALVIVTEHVAHRSPLLRPFLLVGVLGGWTTYSTLSVDTVLLAKDGSAGTCLAYVVATVAGGLGLVVLGHAAGHRLVQS